MRDQSPVSHQRLESSAVAPVLVIYSSLCQGANPDSKKRGLVLDVKFWHGQCKELVRRMIVSPDSEPFRRSVDLFAYPVKQLLNNMSNACRG